MLSHTIFFRQNKIFIIHSFTTNNYIGLLHFSFEIFLFKNQLLLNGFYTIHLTSKFILSGNYSKDILLRISICILFFFNSLSKFIIFKGFDLFIFIKFLQ